MELVNYQTTKTCFNRNLNAHLLLFLIFQTILRTLCSLIWSDYTWDHFWNTSLWYMDEYLFATINSISVFNFYCLVTNFYKRYRNVNIYLEQLCNSKNNSNSITKYPSTINNTSIRHIGKLYRILTEGVNCINSIFGIKMIFFNIYVFLNILTCFLFIYDCAVYKFYNRNILLIYGILATFYTVSIHTTYLLVF